MKRTRRSIVFGSLFLLALLAGFVAIAYQYRARLTRRAVLTALGQHYDGYIELDTAAFPIGGVLRLRGIRLHESASARSPVLAAVDRAEVSGSWGSLWHPQFDPAAITLYNPVLVVSENATGGWSLSPPLRSADNDPARMIPVHIENGRLELRRAGNLTSQTTKHIEHVRADLKESPDDAGIEFSGELSDPLWGEWRFSGTWQRATSRLHTRARAASLELQPEQAHWLGPRWQTLADRFRPTGLISVDADVTWDPAAPEPLAYQVLIDPQHGSLQVPSVAARIEQVTGRVEVTRHGVSVHGLVGELAGGELNASGTIQAAEPRDFKLTARARRLPLVPLTGAMFARAAASDPRLNGTLVLAGTRDPGTWSGGLDGQVLIAPENDPIELHAEVRDGWMTLKELEFRWGDGRWTASAELPLAPNTFVQGSLRLEDIELADVWALAGEATAHVRGRTAGTLRFAVPLDAWADSEQWACEGPIEIHQAVFGDAHFDVLAGKLSCERRTIRLAKATAEHDGAIFDGDVTLDTRPPYTIRAPFRMLPTPLRHASRETTPGEEAETGVAGEIEATGVVAGTLVPEDLAVGGSATIHRLVVGRRVLGDVHLDYQRVGRGLDLDGAELDVFGGKVQARGRWEWASGVAAAPGSQAPARGHSDPARLTLEGDWQGVEADQLAAAWATGLSGVRGKTSGTFEFSRPLEAGGVPVFTAELRAPRLWWNNLPGAQGVLRYEQEGDERRVPRWSVRLAAGELHGSVELVRDGEAPAAVIRVAGESLDLEQALRDAGSAPAAPPGGTPRGRLVMDGEFRIDPETGRTVGSGKARVTRLGLPGLPVIDSLETRFTWSESKLWLDDCAATGWGGTARGRVLFDLSPGAPTWANITLDRVDKIELVRLAEAWPAVAGKARGKISGRGRLLLPRPNAPKAISGTGDYVLEAALLAGLPITQGEGTVEAGRQQVLIRLRNARANRGTLDADALIRLAEPAQYETNVRFTGLDLATVARSVFASPHPVVGTLSGDMQLRGTDRGSQDATGEMHLRVSDANLWPVPVFAALAKVMNLNLAKSGAFRDGEVRRATLKDRTLTLDEFWLSGAAAQLYGQGVVTLDGQIKLEVVGNASTPIPRDIPVLGTLRRAIDYLQQRLVKIHLNGTLNDPVAVPVPLHDLTEPAIRFFTGVVNGAMLGNEPRTRPMGQ